ncbi:hypothetical protein AA14337_2916 [Acetobacter malorum DSM 14337]|uniref:Uncharacterized protein n=1 Tax=Acetobacter malorum DSM 14337 TaxID=1307910 RepID=A0ABQ0PYK1_9PROT|nr:hypothetical protein [Acetobacter malorum]KXV06779.1 hypothetical protein AD930_06685 [Acetobacter malorum]GBQ84799.1 hypothetical protein AA14337_2916 [Acetobacter malorum DSM 14337]
MTQHYSVQLSIFVGADNEAEACDALAEGLREVAPDWGYLEYGEPKPCHTSAGQHVARIAVLVPGDNERECLQHLNEMLEPVAISWAVSPDGPSVSEYDPTCPSYDEGDFLASFREPNPEDLHILMQAPGE